MKTTKREKYYVVNGCRMTILEMKEHCQKLFWLRYTTRGYRRPIWYYQRAGRNDNQSTTDLAAGQVLATIRFDDEKSTWTIWANGRTYRGRKTLESAMGRAEEVVEAMIESGTVIAKACQ